MLVRHIFFSGFLTMFPVEKFVSVAEPDLRYYPKICPKTRIEFLNVKNRIHFFASIIRNCNLIGFYVSKNTIVIIKHTQRVITIISLPGFLVCNIKSSFIFIRTAWKDSKTDTFVSFHSAFLPAFGQNSIFIIQCFLSVLVDVSILFVWRLKFTHAYCCLAAVQALFSISAWLWACLF